jgi:hypothetical protein
MAARPDSKLNRLLQLPEGVLVDAAWLERKGYSRSLRSQYVKSGWLNQVARRVYRRTRGPLEWQHVVISLQAFMDYPLTVGGRTALEELGYAHYLGERREVHLYGPRRPPTWLDTLPLPIEFNWHNSLRLFPDEPAGDMPGGFEPGSQPGSLLPGGFMAHAGGMRWPLRLSSAERAVFELLDELPERESFHQVDMLMQGLATLSPGRLQQLLETCRSVKVKRLFFFFADRHRHAWLGRLDKDRIDLGAGKRSLIKGGRLDPTYLITVPGDLDGYS